MPDGRATSRGQYGVFAGSKYTNGGGALDFIIGGLTLREAIRVAGATEAESANDCRYWEVVRISDAGVKVVAFGDGSREVIRGSSAAALSLEEAIVAAEPDGPPLFATNAKGAQELREEGEE